LIKIDRSVLIEISRIEFLDDTRYCEIVKMNARGENIFDVFQIRIDVKSVVLEVVKFDKGVSDRGDDGGVVAVVQGIVPRGKLLLHRLGGGARRVGDMLVFLRFLAGSQLPITTGRVLILALLGESL